MLVFRPLVVITRLVSKCAIPKVIVSIRTVGTYPAVSFVSIPMSPEHGSTANSRNVVHKCESRLASFRVPNTRGWVGGPRNLRVGTEGNAPLSCRIASSRCHSYRGPPSRGTRLCDRSWFGMQQHLVSVAETAVARVTQHLSHGRWLRYTAPQNSVAKCGLAS
jgi:hypothetical protein